MNKIENNAVLSEVLCSLPNRIQMVKALVKEEKLWMTKIGIGELFGVMP